MANEKVTAVIHFKANPDVTYSRTNPADDLNVMKAQFDLADALSMILMEMMPVGSEQFADHLVEIYEFPTQESTIDLKVIWVLDQDGSLPLPVMMRAVQREAQ